MYTLTPTVHRLSARPGTPALDKTRNKDNVEEEEQDPRHGHSHNNDEGYLPLHLQDRLDGPGLGARRRSGTPHCLTFVGLRRRTRSAVPSGHGPVIVFGKTGPVASGP